MTTSSLKIFLTISAIALALGLSYGQDKTSIRFYGHPGLDFYSNSQQKSSSAYFRGGPLIIYATSQLSDRVSIAAELNAHYMAVTGAEVELERMYLRYNWKDALSFRVGRMYSPIGYWNTSYNFGLVLQPNISRPRILSPPHDGGFLQTREIGLQFEGDNISSAGFFYRFLISNGIGKTGGLLGVPYQLGNKLSYTLQLGIEPADGLRISVSGVINELDQGSPTQYDGLVVPEDMSNNMLAASISHMSFDKKFEFIGEYFSNQHNYQTLEDKTLSGGIVYLGYRTSPKVTPYAFVEFYDFPDNDPYYPLINEYTGQEYTSATEINLGIRYKVSADLVLKFEGAYLDQDVFGTSYGMKTQVAFSF
jgi:hypothetical protein